MRTKRFAGRQSPASGSISSCSKAKRLSLAWLRYYVGARRSAVAEVPYPIQPCNARQRPHQRACSVRTYVQTNARDGCAGWDGMPARSARSRRAPGYSSGIREIIKGRREGTPTVS
eukprot:3372002-Pleurochrysis_carterae.AAC.2